MAVFIFERNVLLISQKRKCLKNTIHIVYRGAAHNCCNLQCRKPLILPVIFHNLQGYDAHLFIKQPACLSRDLNCIPSTEEKYISFSKKIKVHKYKSRRTGETVSLSFEIRYKDSYKFLQSSLANLVSNLLPSEFCNTKAIIKNNVELLTKKEFIHMIMFHLLNVSLRHSFHPNQNSIQN